MDPRFPVNRYSASIRCAPKVVNASCTCLSVQGRVQSLVEDRYGKHFNEIERFQHWKQIGLVGPGG